MNIADLIPSSSPKVAKALRKMKVHRLDTLPDWTVITGAKSGEVVYEFPSVGELESSS